MKASFEPVEVLIVTVPTEETIAFGASSLEDPAAGHPVLEEAWATRSHAPAVIAPGHTGQVVVVIPPPQPPEAVTYVHEFSIDATVGDHTETWRWESLHMVGPENECDSLQASLP